LKVIGLDPGSRVTGYGVVRDLGGGSLELCAYGDIKPRASAPLAERLFKISEELNLLIEQEKPDAVSVETVFYSKNVKSVVTLSHVRGVLLLSAAAGGITVFEYSPTTIKQAVVGYGNATKEQVQKMVKILLKTDARPNPDAADAIAAAICHINHQGSLLAAAK
jgi:crossover junction endodeoxyribonuclease RuvC